MGKWKPDEIIKNNAIKGIKAHNHCADYKFCANAYYDGFVEGAHSRDEEIEKLKREIESLKHPWHRTKDEMPEMNEEVIVRYSNGDVDFDQRSINGEGEGYWWKGEDDICGVVDDELKITHWMRLPKIKGVQTRHLRY